MDSRELTYFVAVAEELNFGRAATRLGIAQPPLSRAVQRLERRLGVPLLVRTSRSVALTEAGRVLLRDGRTALAALAAAERRAQRAGGERLVLATKPNSDGGVLAKVLARYGGEVDMRLCGIGEQGVLLRQGEADVALLRLPYDETEGFAYEELLTEQEVAVLPRTHHLADRTSLTMADLADEPFPQWPGRPANGGPLVRDSAQLLQLIALGRIVALLPASCHAHLRRDLTCVPVTDAPMSTLAVAWPEDARSRPLAEFVRAAVECAAAGAPVEEPTATPVAVSTPAARTP